ncbi:helix-turn-helix transcriptional regulator [Enterococcus hulanensis]|uniref:ArsR/SmtB family transcription factor n=1 Tax=Enterococcus hulanensis TaxID=2559929 RepID=UPI001A8E3592|nr:metalloregulator ArsR/SmtB family transcription factor [Enterococcus hulanensis]MBO0455846.1 helix-turn-helix transcriptional regulator [Enterococcus hulanensis]
MNGIPDLENTLQLIGDPTRIELLTVLIDNRYYTVTELSKKSRVSLSTTSYHLKKLAEANWVDTYRQGRNVYYSLIDESIASIIEQLMAISAPKTIKSYKQKQDFLQIKNARTCYSHLAGRFGVNLFDYFLTRDFIEKQKHEVYVTQKGTVFFKEIGLLQIEQLSGKLCMDWSERKFHLAGSLGKAVCQLFLKEQWIKKSDENRSVQLLIDCPDWLKKI